MHKSTRNNPGPDPLDPSIIAAIREAVREEVKQTIRDEVKTRLDSIDESIRELNKLNQRILDLDSGLRFTTDRVESLVKRTLPELSSHIAQVSEAIAIQNLELHVHDRKWNLILNGLPGPAAEEAHVTRSSCVKFGNDVLKFPDEESMRFTAYYQLVGRQTLE